MPQMKVYICCKTLSTHIEIQKKRMPLYLIAQGYYRKTVKVKDSRVKCAPACIVEGIRLIARDACSSDTETITDLGDQ